MSSEEISLVASHNGLNSQLLFPDDSLRFNCPPPPPPPPPPPHLRRRADPSPKTRDLTGFIHDKLFSSASPPPPPLPPSANSDHRFFPPPPPPPPPPRQPPELPRLVYRDEAHNWNATATGTSGDDSDPDEDDDYDEDDDHDLDDSEVEAAVTVSVDNNSNTNKDVNNTTTTTTTNNPATAGATNLDKMRNGKHKQHSTFGEMMKNAVTIAEQDGEIYYSHYLQPTEGSSGGGKDMGLGVENGCGFSARKEGSSFSTETGESLRAILSDPVTGSLMDDAMILPCGHSFGDGGIQHVIRMKACYTCSQPITEDSISLNLSLRAAVQAFRREKESQFHCLSKRRRERFDQEKGSYGDSTAVDPLRVRGVQFPFAVTDRVIIKGNKRTPQRFVGREAVVTTQCLNGWYVVKTLDNAESVKLQYRSLAKVSDDPTSKSICSKMTSNRL